MLAGLDSQQRMAVTTDARPLCILAGAGSGKTRVLTHRIAHRALTGDADPRRVLALTFTRKAAGEDARLARPRPGQDAEGLGVGGHRLSLGGVEIGDEARLLHAIDHTEGVRQERGWSAGRH